MNYETKFIKYAQSHGAVGYSKLWRKGYPDFMVLTSDQSYLFEVKGKASARRPYDALFNKDQIAFFDKHRYSAKLAFFGKDKKWQFFFRLRKNEFLEVPMWG